MPDETVNRILPAESRLPQEAFTLPRVSTLATPTLVTLDIAETITEEQAAILDLSDIGWDPYPDEAVPAFMTRYQNATGRSLMDTMTCLPDSLDMRLGGTSFMTVTHLGKMNPEINDVRCYAPIGSANGHTQPLVDAVNSHYRRLSSGVDKLTIVPTLHEGRLSPVIFTFTLPGKERKMVLLEGCKQDGVNPGEIAVPEGAAQIVDSYELMRPDSPYGEAIMQTLRQQPDTLTVVGLGSTRVIPQATEHILRFADAANNLAISGNREEIVLLQETLGTDSVTGIFDRLGTRFILETNGQQGAQLHLAHTGGVLTFEYQLPDTEIYRGDNTNAGDVFLAATLNGLLSLNGSGIDAAADILPRASRYTYDFLRTRGT